MNGLRARMLRKQVYHDLSTRITEYSILEHVKKFFKMLKGKETEIEKVTGQLLCRGLRAQYKYKKKMWKEYLKNGGRKGNNDIAFGGSAIRKAS